MTKTKLRVGQKVDCNPIDGSFHLECNCTIVRLNVLEEASRGCRRLIEVRDTRGRTWLVLPSDIR